MRRFASATARTGLVAGLCLAAGPACRRTTTDRARAATSGAAADQAAADTLGRELFLLLDQMSTYQGAHRGHPARSVAELGLDSLGPAVVRRIVPGTGDADVPGAQVAYRRAEGRPVRSCSATLQVLEDAALGGGRFTVHCTVADGSDRPFTVASSSSPR